MYCCWAHLLLSNLKASLLLPAPAAAPLQAASNLTLVNDSRPISPGPFLSAYVSSAAGDSGSRPVSPHLYDQPATPGSHAAPRSEAGASAGGGGVGAGTCWVGPCSVPLVSLAPWRGVAA